MSRRTPRVLAYGLVITGALASIALGAAALGLALAPQYRRRYTFAQLLPADVTDPAQVEQAFSTSVAALNERAAERNNQR